ncbi:hypothetical protein quinque_002446 [Culex quinquefasciatus]
MWRELVAKSKQSPTIRAYVVKLHWWPPTKISTMPSKGDFKSVCPRAVEKPCSRSELEKGQLKHWLNPGTIPDPGNEVGADGNPAGGSGTSGNGTPAPGSGYGTPRTPGNHNTGGNGGNGGGTGNENGVMDRRLAHLERMLSGLTVTVTGMAEQQKSQLNQSQGGNGNALGNPTGSIQKEKPRLRVRRSEACQRIDAVDMSLNPSGEISHQRMVNNVDVEESENDSEASADVNVVRTRQARDNRYTARRREQPEQEGEREKIDPDYEELAAKIASSPTEYADYRVIDGRIMKYVKSSSRQQDPRFAWKQFPMPEERREIIQQEHDKAHFGFEKTVAAIKQRFFWPKMNEQIRKFCRECLPCQTSKAGNVNVTPPMGSQKPVEYPWQFVTLDYIGPLPASGKNRCSYLLVATDVFSKFVLVQPFREAKAGPLADFVENMIFRLFGGLLESYHVTHWLTPAYHPQVNNTERVNRVITTAIRATLKKEHKHWADDIQAIAAAIRTAVHNSTKYSPYFIVFGRDQVSDGREYSRIRDTHAPEATKETEVSAQRKKLFEDVKRNLAAAYQRHAKQYNLRSSSNCPKYAVGEKVLKKTFDLSDKGAGFCKKLAPKYEPCVVKKVLGSNTYELETDEGKRIGVYFTDQLKKLKSAD